MRTKIIFAVFVTVLFSTIAFAIPGIPNAFYGTVTVNGNPSADGIVVTAKIDNVEVASTTTSGGNYGYPIGSFYVDDPDNDRSGETISFFVSGVDTGQTASFINSEVTKLDLSATVATTTTQPSGGGGGGGSSPPGGGGGSPPTTTTTTTTTVPAASAETTTTTTVPETTETIPEEPTGSEAPLNSITGLFISALTDPVTALIVIILIAIIIYILWKMFGKGKSGYKYKPKGKK